MKLTINNLGELVLDVPSDILAHSFYSDLRNRYYNSDVTISTPDDGVKLRELRENIMQAIDGANALMQSGSIKSVIVRFGDTRLFIGRKDKSHE